MAWAAQVLTDHKNASIWQQEMLHYLSGYAERGLGSNGGPFELHGYGGVTIYVFLKKKILISKCSILKLYLF